MGQNRKTRGIFLAIIVIFLSLQTLWMEAIENKDSTFLDRRLTKKETNLIQIQLNQTFGGSERDYAVEVIQTADGGFLIAGSTESYGEGDSDMWLVKTDVNGSVEWNQTYDIQGSDWASDLIQTADGGFLLIGTSSYQNMLPVIYSGSVLKVFVNGTKEWCQTYGYSRTEWYADEHSYIHSAVQTADGGFLFTGETTDYYVGDSGPNNMDMWLVKTDINGSLEWNKTYGSADDSASAVIQTADDGFLIAGTTVDYHYTEGSAIYPHNGDMWLVKIYTNGSVEWDQAYGGSEHDYAREVIQTTDGGLLLAGTMNFWTNDSDMWLVKTDANGSMEWNQTYGGLNDESASAVIQVADGGFLIAGSTESYGAGDKDVWLVKTYANGTVKWNQTIGGSERDGSSSVIQTTNGDFLIVGYTESYGAGDYDMWLLKFSETRDTPTESMTNTLTEEETSPTNPYSATSESTNLSVLIIGFETPLVLVVFLLGVLTYKRKKKTRI
ncbi:MAG: hypothetical protein JSW11_08995 [Candidatus Heimdallarchaeota archaeon]|nr:MAG: hypothetical protein JSW11_08995 [Candidatus Heimdallarchaeota archaeon]